ncbi:NADH-quinone oxidoreductase subunit C [Maridesulfovibrio hydrothermalis]|uniref:NADH dehydrogenase (Ubiquinone) 30 kDa subunit n=1 Tax=Maridesulfovibrio hydrothermalis AM13 = DSM 14728 TaxID=1121451 RepID=L0RE70_9BACT|nr:NADH-quinone oxidoreductase subunit C [Maridesulfovibrio hydrothermalis]CCO25054.1 NADH dehydrogenase (Ubiquinone) 30 kDa subunit [Maridesulfovibrio hydrothermalis AM13 = DSM 14728]
MQVDEKWLESVAPLMVSRLGFEKTGINYNIFLSSEDVPSAAKSMLAREYHLENIDALHVDEGFLITYHYTHFNQPERIVHRVLIPTEEPELPTISDVYQGADWHERECNDFHGVIFSGHPNLIPLLLDPETPNGVLLKDAKSLKPLRDLIDPGKVVFKADGFTLFDKVPED